MDAEGLFDRLIESEVVSEAPEGLRLAESFLETVGATEDALESSADSSDEITAHLDDTGFADRLTAVAGDDLKFVAYACSLADHLPESVSSGEIARITALLEHIDGSFPPTEGAPNAFFPIHPFQIGTLTALFPRSIVYIWLDDCIPCDTMRADFDDIFEEHPDDLALFAVYGPDDPTRLHDEYTVVGGPATLFFVWDSVDTRFYGARTRMKTESEIETLREIDAFDPAQKPS